MKNQLNKCINLLNYRKCEYSSIGNDGIIEYIFRKLNIDQGIFVEFGAWDGIKNSNCRGLFENKWGGIFIEDNRDKYKQLKNNYKNNKNIHCYKSKVGFKEKELFDNIVNPFLKGGNIDFCSIDIDGLDLEVFETFQQYLPTVICIEGGQMLYPYHKRIKKSLAKYNIQQSLKIMVDSFEKKGYKILCSYQDSFFVKEELYSIFNVESDLMKLYFNGLRAIHRRMPFIQKYIKKIGLTNVIVDDILRESSYVKYKWSRRKEWAEKEKNSIFKIINNIERKRL